ncbi:hypothetical protein STRTUCAR8_01877 [Streptomyces turgidiscabies Car8]|uniref:Uncharacterized protein n=1 Tax=Streptomyces turgidiscabies (strain Car8) TaxID=698760 RepID=L7F3Z2_STRT8|nr:hypothetical protein STRTUCAR8_01877 [Streptomyces turgidiscabies Car8]
MIVLAWCGRAVQDWSRGTDDRVSVGPGRGCRLVLCPRTTRTAMAPTIRLMMISPVLVTAASAWIRRRRS